MKGMILAAGYGTRFRPATFAVPKPMVPLGNRPLIAWLVESLISAGVSEIVVNLHHLPEQIESFLRGHYGQRCRFVFSFEPEILGTGGGVRKVREVLESQEMFLLVNGDTVQQPAFAELTRMQQQTGAVATLLLRHAPANDRFTPVMFDGGWVTGFGQGRGEPLMFAGAHAVSRRIFELLPDNPFSSMVEDVYAPLVRQGNHIAGVVYDDRLWFDIGTPLRYLTASLEILDRMNRKSLSVPEGSRLTGGSLMGANSEGSVETSVVGASCSIAAGAKVRGSVLWDEVAVGSGSAIESAVLAHGVIVPGGSRVENALVSRQLANVQYDNNFLVTGGLVAAPIDPQRELVLHLRGS